MFFWGTFVGWLCTLCMAYAKGPDMSTARSTKKTLAPYLGTLPWHPTLLTTMLGYLALCVSSRGLRSYWSGTSRPLPSLL